MAAESPEHVHPSGEKTKWYSPPLCYQMKLTATTYSRQNNESADAVSIHPAGDTTPMSCSSCNTDDPTTLPVHKISQSLSANLYHKYKASSILDVVTKGAGSRLVFLLTLGVLALWAILGIALGATEIWQIIIQNASSVQCYVSDTLLIRQQQNNCCEFLAAIGELRSRNRSLSRMLKNLSPSQREALRSSLEQEPLVLTKPAPKPTTLQSVFDKVCDVVATAVGSLPSVIIYAMGVCVWLGLGTLYQFNDLWQLYINTAVAVELTFTSMFLQNVRRRHADALNTTLQAIKHLDGDLESRLRQLTDDDAPHESFQIEHPETRHMERFIDLYAFVVGSGVGVLISAVVLVVWIALGHLLSWDSNWWLIIGTYTGLVGFTDGFVLRNVYFRQTNLLNEHLQSLSEADSDLFSLLNLQVPPSRMVGKREERERTLSYRVSDWMITVCSKPQAVVGSVGVVIALLAVATGLMWSETGQLLCNTPTMIVEGFFLLVLFQAHNMTMIRRWEQFEDVAGRREELRRGLVGIEVVHGYGDVKKNVKVTSVEVPVEVED